MRNFRQIFLTAAERIHNKEGPEFSCVALGNISGSARRRYEAIFFDGDSDASPYQIAIAVGYKYGSYPEDGPTKEMIDFRVMLLCMAAACYKDFK